MAPAKVAHTYRLVHAAALRVLAVVYFFAFLSAYNQGPALVGAAPDGILPFDTFMQRLEERLGPSASPWERFLAHPTLFWFLPWNTAALRAVALAGVGLSMLAAVGMVNAAAFALLWLLYNSVSAVGQVFMGYGWELQICETGFLAIFALPPLSPAATAVADPPRTVVWLNRWLIARIMVGAGLIKIRGDPCWRDFTCLDYHYETQPIPNPLSWYLHHGPRWAGPAGVLFNHVVELLAPFLLLAGRRARVVTGALFVGFQLTLIASGNLSFLNWLTIVPALWCFDDDALRAALPTPVLAVLTAGIPFHRVRPPPGGSPHPTAAPSTAARAAGAGRALTSAALVALVAVLSREPVANLVSPGQAMNRGFDPFHLVNTYGAFGSVGKRRHEVVLWATNATDPGRATWWEVPFICKPGHPARRPCVQAPYHHRIDWQIWFAAMQRYEQNPWLLHFCAKLLAGDPLAYSLLADDAPFGPGARSAMTYLRADLYRVQFSKPGSAAAARGARARPPPRGDAPRPALTLRAGEWYVRKFERPYIPVPLSLDNPSFQDALRGQGWHVPTRTGP